jgi:malic enzyme
MLIFIEEAAQSRPTNQSFINKNRAMFFYRTEINVFKDDVKGSVSNACKAFASALKMSQPTGGRHQTKSRVAVYGCGFGHCV